jgi:hypothetical protein
MIHVTLGILLLSSSISGFKWTSRSYKDAAKISMKALGIIPEGKLLNTFTQLVTVFHIDIFSHLHILHLLNLL